MISRRVAPVAATLALALLAVAAAPRPAAAREPGAVVLAQAAAPAAAPAAAAPAAVAPAPEAPAATPAAAPAATPVPPKFDVVSMVMHADIVVQCVMGFLILCSISTWTILIQKTLVLGQASRSSMQFLSGFRGARTVHDIALRTVDASVSPVSRMWGAAKGEWDLFQAGHVRAHITPHQADGLVQRMAVAANIAQESEMLRMSSSMGILATIGSTAPFIGLFGTVWGILTSFVGIAASKATSLAAVAPGIAEALLATAIGLVAAIPAVMIYNKFARQISQVSGMLDNFQGELATVVSREMEVVG